MRHFKYAKLQPALCNARLQDHGSGHVTRLIWVPE